MARDYTELDRLIYQMDKSAIREEHRHALDTYKPLYMVNITCKYKMPKNEFRRNVKNYLHQTARGLAKVFKRMNVEKPHKHLPYEYWYDYQPNRIDNEDVYHAHIFTGIEGVEIGSPFLKKNFMKDSFWFRWNYGEVYVEEFDKTKGGVIYSRQDHGEWADGVGCSNGQHKCSGNKCGFEFTTERNSE